MKQTRLLLLFFILFFLFSCEKEEVDTPYYGRTVFVYLIADNNISSSLYNNIPDMLKGMRSYGKRCELVIYWDGPNGVPTLSRYRVNDKGKLSDEIVLASYEEHDSTSPEVMSKVFQDFFRLCPSKKYGLIMGSHAHSWLPQEETRGFGDDGGNEIAIPDLAKTIADVIPQPFDYILFDACLMSSIEVSYELRELADYIISSPAEILAYGFPYFDLIANLYSENINDYTVKVAERFITYYSNSFATIAVTKCDELDKLATITQKIITNYVDELANFNVSSLQKYDRSVLRYTYFAFDFEHFIKELATEEEYLEFKDQLDKVIIYKDFINVYTPIIKINPENYSGIASYIMQSRHSYLNEYYKTLSWYTASGWDKTSW